MDTLVGSRRISGDPLIPALIVGGIVLAALIGWLLVDWAVVDRPTTCPLTTPITRDAIDRSGRQITETITSVPCIVPAVSWLRAGSVGLVSAALGAGAVLLALYAAGDLRTRELPPYAITSGDPSTTEARPPLPRPAAPVAAGPPGAPSKVVLRCIDILDRTEPGTGPDPLTRQQLETVLKEAGFEPFEADGQMFDVRCHHAVERLLVDDEHAAGVVVATERVGWRQGTHVVRPADVIVSELRPE